MPVSLSAPVKVVVFQWPCGTPARQRSLQGARPRKRAILVEERLGLAVRRPYAFVKGRFKPQA